VVVRVVLKVEDEVRLGRNEMNMIDGVESLCW